MTTKEFPNTTKDYWKLTREEREALYLSHGYGWKTVKVWEEELDRQIEKQILWDD